MPCGRFVNGAFEITVTFDYNASEHEMFTLWPRSLQKAAELFYHATEGQLRISRWLLANRSYGLDAAEIVLHEQGEASYASAGGFGSQAFAGFPLLQVHLAPHVKFNPMTIVHELAHQIFGLRDEYTGAVDTDVIVPSAAASTTVIPIDNPARAGNALAGQYAGMQKGTLLERRLVTSSTASAVVVNSPFSFPANEDNSGIVFYQNTNATCHEGPGANPDGYLCLMEESGNVGTLDVNGIWTPYAGNAPSTDFCSLHNHDLIANTNTLDGDTFQHVTHQQSCWATVAQSMAERYSYPMNAPNPPSLQPTAGWSSSLLPDVTYLAEERRLALVIDRSGSMGESSKWESALFAATYWVDRLRIDAQLGGLDISLAVISYNHSAQTHLPLTEGTNLPTDTDTLFNGLSPSGWTNMRAALNTAREMVAPSQSERAATQAIVLLTDGVHNYPDGSEFNPATVASDTDIQALSDSGVRVMPLGFGEADDSIDMPALEAISKETCGSFPFLVANPLSAEMQTAMMYELLVGGLGATVDASLPPSPSSPSDQKEDTPIKSRPPLEKWLDAFRVDVKTLLDARRWPKVSEPELPLWRTRFHVVPVWVEDGAERTSFTLRHPQKQPVWLYLTDPDNKPHPLDDNATRHVTGDSYTFTVIGKPKPGLWHMVAVRPTAGDAINFHAFCGIAHRQLVVDAGVSGDNECAAPVMISGAAVWGERLTGLRVQASVTGPDGVQKTLLLNDTDQDEPTGSGNYRVYFQPNMDGRYQGELRINGPDNAQPAQMIHRVNHARIGAEASKVESIEIKAEASRFVRIVPFSFWSGERPKVTDKDRRR